MIKAVNHHCPTNTLLLVTHNDWLEPDRYPLVSNIARFFAWRM